jgi:hypothetical protein
MSSRLNRIVVKMLVTVGIIVGWGTWVAAIQVSATFRTHTTTNGSGPSDASALGITDGTPLWGTFTYDTDVVQRVQDGGGGPNLLVTHSIYFDE